jgi:hypothetical protein
VSFVCVFLSFVSGWSSFLDSRSFFIFVSFTHTLYLSLTHTHTHTHSPFADQKFGGEGKTFEVQALGSVDILANTKFSLQDLSMAVIGAGWGE